VWGKRGGWEIETYRKKRRQREAEEQKHTQGEEGNRKKRWEAEPTQQGGLPDKS